MSSCKTIFSTVEYGYAAVPTYPSGCIGFFVMSVDKVNIREPLRTFGAEFEQRKLKYYNSAVHSAAFCLPQFVSNALRG